MYVCVLQSVLRSSLPTHLNFPRYKQQVHISGLSLPGFNRCTRHHCASRSQRKWRRINVTHQWFASSVITRLSSLKLGAIVKCGQKTSRLCWPRKALFARCLHGKICIALNSAELKKKKKLMSVVDILFLLTSKQIFQTVARFPDCNVF